MVHASMHSRKGPLGRGGGGGGVVFFRYASVYIGSPMSLIQVANTPLIRVQAELKATHTGGPQPLVILCDPDYTQRGLNYHSTSHVYIMLLDPTLQMQTLSRGSENFCKI